MNPTEEPSSPIKFGTLVGVFAPTVLTILGAIMYLREGWTVGNAGLGGALLIILLAHVITITTGLAVSSIATNIRVGAGGAFAIIAQSLGLEAGGSIGLPLYLAQTVSTALYVLAFAEGWAAIYPEHATWAVALVAFGGLALLALISTQIAAKSQLLIMAVVLFSLVSVGLGALPSESGAGMIHAPQWWGSFEEASFWDTFAIFFPAVTGIMAGISLSGNLEDPRRSIPRGTLGGIAVTLAIYLALAYWLSRVATPDELTGTMTIMVEKARWSWAVLAGLLGATFSSALGSLVAAPRVVHALAQNNILPASAFFAREDRRGEPRNAMFATAVLAFVTLVVALLGGGLNFLAPLITMFFLLTYAMLNLVVLVEQMLGMVSFRPTFGVPKLVPLVGLVSCTSVMFFVNPGFSLASVVLALLTYVYLLRHRLPAVNTGDVRSGLFLSLARWGAIMVTRIPPAPERTWEPNVVAAIAAGEELQDSYRLLRSVAGRRGGVRLLGVYPPDHGVDRDELPHFARDLQHDGVFARYTEIEHPDLVAGASLALQVLHTTVFKPNILFLRLVPGRELDVDALLTTCRTYGLALMLYRPHPSKQLGDQRRINVWVREQGPDWTLGLRLSNLDLALLLAYQIAATWDGRFRLCMAVEDTQTQARAERYLGDLLRLGRLEARGAANVYVGSFPEVIAEAPPADLSLLGLPRQPNMESMQRFMDAVDGSCLLVRDSGNESVLA
ncbi:MAG: Na-K-Cl cotransporter [Planctomycetes bacterium]|nr:Na-K-Cl cotransporter [Planctomycetota bacterium]